MMTGLFKKDTKSTNPVLYLNKHMIKERAGITNERAALPYESGVSWQLTISSDTYFFF